MPVVMTIKNMLLGEISSKIRSIYAKPLIESTSLEFLRGSTPYIRFVISPLVDQVFGEDP
jgi:hypothetical protein